jgi:alginate O-acetyltransferase complex protein AlgI
MNFISLPFLVFAACVLPLYFLVPGRWKWAWLLAASYAFYSFAGMTALALLVTSTLLVYAAGLGLDKAGLPGKRRLIFVLGLISALAGLLIFKYADFFGRLGVSAARLFEPGIVYKPLGLAYVAGLSFYSFKLASYLVDVYRKKCPAERHAGYFALYAAYFPQLLMGPIDRAVRFLPELKKRVVPDLDRIIAGIGLIAWGVFKKIAVADRLGFFVNDMFAKPEHKGLFLLFGAYFYAFQIYCDFSGYTDIAIGLSKILGYDSAENFRTPYASRSLPEFWSRWHITLSTWLRDYLFLPIAYKTLRGIKEPARLGIKAEAWAYGIGIAVTWALGGLWHGAAWTFVVFGLLHGSYLIVSNATKKPRRRLVRRISLNRLPRFHHAIQILITFNLVSLAWIFFRAKSPAAALAYLHNFSTRIPDSGGGLLLAGTVLIVAVIGLEALFKNPGRRIFWQRLPGPLKVAAFALGLCLIVILAVSTGNEFIYFNF